MPARRPCTDGGGTSEYDAPAVCLEQVRFRWPGAREDTLDIDGFSMRRGERVFISGPSGSGKSTLLGLVAGILAPTAGSVIVSGSPLHNMTGPRRDKFRGDHIGFIFQQFNLVPYLSIVENVLIPCHFSPLRLKRAVRGGRTPEQAAGELLRRLDLAPSLWGRAVSRLSIGQQQRVAAARALMGQPELLIADEPTSALDADRRESFLRLLLEECENLGAALLFVSHDAALAGNFPRIVHMAECNRAKGEAT